VSIKIKIDKKVAIRNEVDIEASPNTSRTATSDKWREKKKTNKQASRTQNRTTDTHRQQTLTTQQDDR